MRRPSTLKRAHTSNGNLEDDRQATRTVDSAAQRGPLSCSFSRQAQKSLSERNVWVGGGGEGHVSWSCLCLPFGRARLKSDSCKWVQWGAASSSHPTCLMGSVTYRTLRNPCASRGPIAKDPTGTLGLQHRLNSTKCLVDLTFLRAPAFWQATPWQLLHLNSLLAKLYCVALMPHCLRSLISHADIKAKSICCSELKKQTVVVFNKGW